MSPATIRLILLDCSTFCHWWTVSALFGLLNVVFFMSGLCRVVGRKMSVIVYVVSGINYCKNLVEEIEPTACKASSVFCGATSRTYIQSIRFPTLFMTESK